MERSWPPTETDKVKKLPTADRSAWSWFNRTYRPIIYRTVLGLWIPPADAEDVTQQVMLKMLRADYQGDGLFRSFLLTIVRNACHDYHRRQNRQKNRFQPHGLGGTSHLASLARHPAAEGSDPLEVEYKKQVEQRAIGDVRREVNPTHWEVFSRLLHGEDREQVSQHTGTTPGHTRVIEHRIWKRLVDRAAEIEEEMEAEFRNAFEQSRKSSLLGD